MREAAPAPDKQAIYAAKRAEHTSRELARLFERALYEEVWWRVMCLPAAVADTKLRDDLRHDLAIALIMGGAVEQARQWLAGEPSPDERRIDLDRQLISGSIALATGDQAAAEVAANAVAERARRMGYLLHVLKAGQLAKAAICPPSLERFPHLLWGIEPR